ncbi:porin [Trabulsiella odontotermitis]|uniref:porin n=1 Tax=Trabulsiella odontotermitis TaxID=379893 RepID=UPI0006768838|nr:porin [Trabulsiella odontotermitis]KNC92364.1 porin [Trabulsiella odontotermitis]
MMKRNILAVVIPALLVAGAANAAEIYNKNANKLDLYGKVVGEHGFVTSGDNTTNGDSSYAQIGVKGETQINDQLTGYGQFEYRMLANEAEGSQVNKTRLAFAGLKIADFGSIDYGRNYGIVYDVEALTDVAPSFSGETWAGSTDNYMNNRSTGLLTYRNSDFFGLVDGLNFGIQYQGKNDRDNLKQANGDGVGYSLGYDFAEGFGVIAAYSNANRTTADNGGQKADGRGDKAEAWAFGTKYDANNIYLAAIYSETRNQTATTLEDVYDIANKTQNFEVVAQYQFDFGLRPSVSYVQTKGKDLVAADGSYYDRDLAKYITVGSYYYFNKNFNVYADYRINLLDEDDAPTALVGVDDQVTLGVAYQF